MEESVGCKSLWEGARQPYEGKKLFWTATESALEAGWADLGGWKAQPEKDSCWKS